MMKSVFLGIAFWLLVAVTTQGASPGKENVIRYLAGIEILRTADHLTAEEKGTEYRRLLQATGVSSSDAAAFVERYRNAPGKWKDINSKMKIYIEEAYRDSTERKPTNE